MAWADVPERALDVADPAPKMPTPGKRVALVIGNAEYRFAPPLANPRNDATEIAETLRSLGFEVVEGLDLDRAQMTEHVENFATALQGAEVGWFFYAGHALQVDGQNYLVPLDADLASVEALDTQAVGIGPVVQALEAEPRVSVIVLDACRNNPLARSLTRSLGTRSSGARDGLAALQATAPETLIAFSTQPGATASDGRGSHSPFTASLLGHLPIVGLDVEDVFQRTAADVVRDTAGSQVPWRSSSLTRQVVLRPTAAPLVTAADRARAAQVTAAAAPHLAEAQQAWAAVQPTVSAGGPEAEAALLAYTRRYEGLAVEVDGERVPVAVPEVQLAWQAYDALTVERTMDKRRRNRKELALGQALGAGAVASLFTAGITKAVYEGDAQYSNAGELVFVANRVTLVGGIGLGVAAGSLLIAARF